MRGPTLSQPCLPVAKVGPTRVLNYLYVGSQQDVLNEDIMRANGINYVLNVSKTCPSPTHIAPGHFHRIPVRDNYGEKLLPWFEDAMNFIGESSRIVILRENVLKWQECSEISITRKNPTKSSLLNTQV